MFTLLLGAALATALGGSDSPGKGVSEALAEERAAEYSQVQYALEFVIPESRAAPVQGRETVRLSLRAPHRIVFDFASPSGRVRSVSIGGRPITPIFSDDHLTIPAGETRAGENVINIEFVAGDEALNRNDEFLYTLFVPARAHFAFPSFDQPSIKARYTLSLQVPTGWQVVANGAEGVRQPVANNERLTRVEFAETRPLPTYLFSFAAGRFSVDRSTRNGREFRMFHRETDAAKVARNRDIIFDLHASALRWLEEYTSIPYAFDKFDFVLIPAFQFGGMEHPGAILYSAAQMMLDESATQNQLLGRATLIAHETAHMWFGDLVTMAWFNDVWMKEVFANFMAEKIVNPSFPLLNHDLRFFLGNYPAAYGVDRTAGTNPIRQPLANLDDAGQLYGAIIYQKAPIVMRQLELIVGEDRFRDGMREYLKAYAFGTATWIDLVRILDRRTPQNLARWSQAWVDERGRPEFTANVSANRNNRITRLTLTATDPLQRPLVWPQRLHVVLGYKDVVRRIPVYVSGQTTRVREAEGSPRPLYILPGGDGLGYGLFVLDQESREYLVKQLHDVPDALTRGTAWVTLWDNLLEGHIAPGALFELGLKALPLESDELNTQRVLSYMTRLYWRFMTTEERLSRAPQLEGMLRDGITRATTQSQKSAWFSTYRDVVLTNNGIEWLRRVWGREEPVPGLTFAETDEIAMAQQLALRGFPDAQRILDTELDRIQNPDRKAQFAFVMPALSADAQVREQAFAGLRSAENRRREPWVLESLVYLNHPLREAHARRFVRPGLDLLLEVRRTGDIFFPTRWIDALLSGHRSEEVAAIVRDFLARELQYPQRLRWTVLSAADELFRAAALAR